MRRARRAYRSAPLGDRFHTWVRWRTCPFAAVESALPDAGRILEIGCGHGLFAMYAAAAAPGRSVVGVDVDESKLEVARAAAVRFGAGAPTFEARPAEDAVTEGWDGIAVVDVLYLLGTVRACELVAAAARNVAPGGVLAVKEIDLRPRWKYHLARLQELVSTRVLRITEGSGVDFVPPSAIAQAMTVAGLEVEQRRVDRWYPYPHLLLIGRRRLAATAVPTERLQPS